MYLSTAMANGRVEDEVRRSNHIHQSHCFIFQLSRESNSSHYRHTNTPYPPLDRSEAVTLSSAEHLLA